MRISEIMDSYTDNEFLIEGQQAVSSDEIAAGVMDRVKAKKPLKLKAKILIIAAAVVGLAGIVGAGINDAFFTTKLGDEISHNGTWIGGGQNEVIPPYTIVGDGDDKKVFFTANNEYIDITDYLERGENYYYYFSEYDNRANEYPAFLCVGGTIDDIGFGECYVQPDFEGYGFSKHNVGAPDEEKEWSIRFQEKVDEFHQEIKEKYEKETQKTAQEEAVQKGAVQEEVTQ